MAKLLIKNGADLNATPSHFARTPDIENYILIYIKELKILKKKQNNIELQNELTNILLPFIKEKHIIPDILSMKFQMEFEEELRNY